jgi:hypothetical protein
MASSSSWAAASSAFLSFSMVVGSCCFFVVSSTSTTAPSDALVTLLFLPLMAAFCGQYGLLLVDDDEVALASFETAAVGDGSVEEGRREKNQRRGCGRDEPSTNVVTTRAASKMYRYASGNRGWTTAPRLIVLCLWWMFDRSTDHQFDGWCLFLIPLPRGICGEPGLESTQTRAACKLGMNPIDPKRRMSVCIHYLHFDLCRIS